MDCESHTTANKSTTKLASSNTYSCRRYLGLSQIEKAEESFPIAAIPKTRTAGIGRFALVRENKIMGFYGRLGSAVQCAIACISKWMSRVGGRDIHDHRKD